MTAALRLDLLGGFRLQASDGRVVEVAAKKSRALLGILALAPNAEATRDRLIGLLWSDRGEEQARSSLRQALAGLHKDFAMLAADPLLTNGDRVALDPAQVSIDALDFLSASASDAELSQAAALYRGPFLDGIGIADDAFEDWLREARTDLASRAIKVLDGLAQSLDGAARIAAAQRLVAVEPLREASHAALIEAHLAQEQIALARKHYEACALLLKRELGIGPGMALQALRQRLQPGAAPARTPATEGRPTIAILAFDNMSGDPAQQYFSDGMTQDLIDRLSRYRTFSVIGHHSSFSFRDQRGATGDAGDQLTANYVVTGNMRKSESRIRVAARLSDARNGLALWAEQYDRPLQDIFAVQDEVTELIASTLAARIGMEIGRDAATGRRNAPPGPAGLSSYEHVLQGMWHFGKLTLESSDLAAACFERAIALLPGNAEAHRWRSACHINRWFARLDKTDLARAVDGATHAVALDPTSARCHTALGLGLIWREGVDGAAESYRKAMMLNPGDPDVLIEVGLHHAFSGDLAAAHDFFDRAYRLNPLPPLWFPEFRAIALFAEGRYAEAWPAFAAIPDSAWDAMYMLACLGHLGDRVRIAECRARIAAAGWDCDLMAAATAEPYRNPEIRQRLLAGLEKAAAL